MGMASVGLQIGVSAAQVIMVVRTQKGLDSLYKSEKGELKLNADASVALLNVGAGAAADTDADFLAFSKVKGAFAGFAVDGAVIAVRSSLNESYYGKPATPLAILLDQSVSNPAATGLQQSLKRLRSMSLSDWVK
jgi:lipid-binding SYLF domain-containing protein